MNVKPYMYITEMFSGSRQSKGILSQDFNFQFHVHVKGKTRVKESPAQPTLRINGYFSIC